MHKDDNLLSRSTFLTLMKLITNGKIKNLAGLDNTDVTKGHDNFQEMERIVKQLAEIGKLQREKYEHLLEGIQFMRIYHKTDFLDHLNISNYRHICSCVKCGFHDEKDDPIPCVHRDNRSHLPPCEKCTKCFRYFGDLYDLFESVREDSSNSFSPLQKDELSNLEGKIRKCNTNFEDYRAHIVQKYWDNLEERDFYKGLKKGEAAVISDWKMKILAGFFKEPMEKFFGKKGFSLMGFMIVYGSDDETEDRETNYVFCLTDDTKQDITSVLATKQYLYSEILAHEGVTKVHFRSDGAGCFAHGVHKLFMPMWKHTTNGKIDEVSFKISVSGNGKTNLDGLFGIIQAMIGSIIEEGNSFDSAKELYELLASNPILASFYTHFVPNRTIIHDVKKVPGMAFLSELTNLYHFKKCEGGMIGYRHVGMGKGTFISFDDAKKAIEVKHSESASDNGNLQTVSILVDTIYCKCLYLHF